jgi:hypothetical protein
MSMNITEQDYELLSQYLDGELPSGPQAQLERRLATEPALQAGLGRLQALQRQLEATYGQLGDGPVPERILALLQGAPERAAQHSSATAKIVRLPARRTVYRGFALAASLVVAVSAVLVSQWDRQSVETGANDSALFAALESTPSRATGWETLTDGRNLRPVLSFRNSSGNWCREYLVGDSEGHWHGVACRGSEGWANEVLTATQLADSSDQYRPAGAADSMDVADYIDRNANGIPLDAREEANIMARGWQ